MLSKKGAASSIQTGMIGHDTTGDTVVVIGVGARVCGVGPCTGCTPLLIIALGTYMAIFLASVASNGFLSVFNDNYSGIGNEDSFK